MEIKKMKSIVSAALFAAIICVATYVVQIPMPATGGYVNLGDCFVLTAGLMLGAGYGALAAGLGSAIADMLAGYMQYVPATFLIKSLMAVTAYLIFSSIKKALNNKSGLAAKIISVVAAEAIMVIGYFCYEASVLGYGIAAAGSIMGNIIQGAVGAAAAVLLSSALEKTVLKSKTLSEFFRKG